MRSPTRLAALTAVAFAVAAGIMAVRAVRVGPLSRDIEALAAAVGSSLPFEARLSGGFIPSDARTTRGAVAPALSPDARIALGRLEKRANLEHTPQALASL